LGVAFSRCIELMTILSFDASPLCTPLAEGRQLAAAMCKDPSRTKN
jgi:hypothetical protein